MRRIDEKNLSSKVIGYSKLDALAPILPNSSANVVQTNDCNYKQSLPDNINSSPAVNDNAATVSPNTTPTPTPQTTLNPLDWPSTFSSSASQKLVGEVLYKMLTLDFTLKYIEDKPTNGITSESDVMSIIKKYPLNCWYMMAFPDADSNVTSQYEFRSMSRYEMSISLQQQHPYGYAQALQIGTRSFIAKLFKDRHTTSLFWNLIIYFIRTGSSLPNCYCWRNGTPGSDWRKFNKKSLFSDEASKLPKLKPGDPQNWKLDGIILKQGKNYVEDIYDLGVDKKPDADYCSCLSSHRLYDFNSMGQHRKCLIGRDHIDQCLNAFRILCFSYKKTINSGKEFPPFPSLPPGYRFHTHINPIFRGWYYIGNSQINIDSNHEYLEYYSKTFAYKDAIHRLIYHPESGHVVISRIDFNNPKHNDKYRELLRYVTPQMDSGTVVKVLYSGRPCGKEFQNILGDNFSPVSDTSKSITTSSRFSTERDRSYRDRDWDNRDRDVIVHRVKDRSRNRFGDDDSYRSSDGGDERW